MNNFEKRTVCPICKNHNVSVLKNIPYQNTELIKYFKTFYSEEINVNLLKDASYKLNKCERCKGIFQELIPNEQLLKIIYEDWVNKQNRNINPDDKSLEFYLNKARDIFQIKYFLSRKNKTNNLTALDFGMGKGDWCKMAQAFGLNTYGYDLADDRIQHGKHIGINMIGVKDIERLEFDIINCDMVFEHILYPYETLKLLKNALSKDGLIKISVPSSNNKIEKILRSKKGIKSKDLLNKKLNPVAPLEHINCFRGNSLTKMGEMLGLKRINIPLKDQYKLGLDLTNMSKFIKSAIYPLYMNYIKKNHAFFVLDE